MKLWPTPPRLDLLRRDRRAPDLVAATGPLHLLQGRRLLVVADVQNLGGVDWKLLGALLRNTAEDADLHAFAGCGGQARHPRSAGWRTHVHPAGPANVDGLMLFVAGELVGATDADTVLAITGDGKLGRELANGTHARRPRLDFFVLARPGNASRQLRASGHIHGNLWLGQDVIVRARRSA